MPTVVFFAESGKRTVATILCAILMLLPVPLAVAEDALTGADRRAIHDIVQAQLDAFQADDAITAFSFASPSIQEHFGDPDNFLLMVKAGYDPVYRPREVYFQEIERINGGVAQKVLIVDRNNDSVLAIYPMEKQTDGSWRISGCFLAPAESTAL